MDLKNIDVIVLTFNEVKNVERLLEGLEEFDSILIIDSFSNDGTLDILRKDSTVKIYQREFDSFSNQLNFGISKAEREYVITLDADYIFSRNLVKEIKGIKENDISGFQVGFRYAINGKTFGGGNLLRDRIVMFRRDKGHFIEDGHQQRLVLSGTVKKLKNKIIHDDRKSLSRWLEAQNGYCERELQKFQSPNTIHLDWKDKIRKNMVLSSVVLLMYFLIIRLFLFRSRQAKLYLIQRVYAELLLTLYINFVDDRS